MKILVVGDTHIGKKVAGFDRTDDAFDRWHEAARFGAEEGCSVMVHLGDVFDNSHPSALLMSRVAESLIYFQQNLAYQTVHIVGGNHEAINRAERVSVLEALEAYRIPNLNTILFGMHQRPGPHEWTLFFVPWVSKAFLTANDCRPDDWYRRLFKQWKCKRSVLFAHAEIEGADVGGWGVKLSGEAHAKVPKTFLRSRTPRFSAAFFGHIHKFQILREEPPAIVMGTPERFDFGDAADRKFCCALTLEEGPPQFKFHELDATEMVELEYSFEAGDVPAEHFPVDLRSMAGAIVKLRITADQAIQSYIEQIDAFEEALRAKARHVYPTKIVWRRKTANRNTAIRSQSPPKEAVLAWLKEAKHPLTKRIKRRAFDLLDERGL